MKYEKKKRQQTIKEEIANSISHALMVPISILVFFIYCRLLIQKKNFNFIYIFPLFLFTFSMFLLYLASSLYHAFSYSKIKYKLQKIDHICIYLLIWGTFVPFLLIPSKLILSNLFFIFNKNIFIFITQTFIVLFCILIKFFYFNKGRKIHLFLFFLLGWNGLFFLKDLLSIYYKIVFFLLLGGFVYSFGVFFYYKSSYYKYYHFIWHIFVILGNFLHILSIYIFLNKI
ncbi:PAQR family membrane homeostasis protein TrhA [Candidatus Phytoplasma oryzae]|nr:hemolysin III family protein [Candidatus Phytoplasma oryzae]